MFAILYNENNLDIMPLIRFKHPNFDDFLYVNKE